MNIDVAVVMPVYNEESCVENAILSILNQSDFENYILIIIDDGSTDNTINILHKYKNYQKILIIQNNHNGISYTLNTGLKKAFELNAKYIVRMDADDISLPGRLRHQFDYMETYNYIDILSSSMNIMGTQNNLILQNHEITIEMLMYGNFLLHPCIIMRTESIRKKHPYLYESSYDKAEDYKFYCTAILNKLRLFSESTIVLSYNQPKTDQISQKEISNKVKMWIRTEYLKMIKE